jgi:hypothetical protein
MDIAKPRSGFNIVEPPAVTALINSRAGKWLRLTVYWADVKSRLAQTGHREGRHVNGPPGARLLVAARLLAEDKEPNGTGGKTRGRGRLGCRAKMLGTSPLEPREQVAP